MATRFLTNKTAIKAWLQKNKVGNYNILEDLSVHINGDVYLMALKLTEIPVKFNSVLGIFNCSNNALTSLDFAPKIIGSSFTCSNNKLTSLVGGPEEVGGSYRCERNKLTTLQGAPKKIDGHFDCSENKLISLQYCPKIGVVGFVCHKNKLTSLKYAPSRVRGAFGCENNELTSLEFVPKYIGNNLYTGSNDISTLEFFPQKVLGGEIYLENNPKLGRIQDLWDFNELVILHAEIVKIKSEQKLLADSLNRNMPTNNKASAKFKI